MGVNVVVGQFNAQDLGLRGIWLIRPPALPQYHHLGELSYPSQASLSKAAANKGQKQLSCYHTLSALIGAPAIKASFTVLPRQGKGVILLSATAGKGWNQVSSSHSL